MKSSKKSGNSDSKSQESETIYLHPEDRPPKEDEEDSTLLDINQSSDSDDSDLDVKDDDADSTGNEKDKDTDVEDSSESGAAAELDEDGRAEQMPASREFTEDARDVLESGDMDQKDTPEAPAAPPATRPDIDYSIDEEHADDEKSDEDTSHHFIPGSALLKMRVLIGGVAAFVLAFGLIAFLIIRGSAGPEQVTVDQLVEVAANGVIFERPEQWLEADFSLDVADKAFTPEGESIGTAVQSIIMKADALGVDFSQASGELRQTLISGFEEGFADPSALEGGPCDDITEVNLVQTDRAEYDLFFTVTAVCGKLRGSIDTATLKMGIGIYKSNLHTIGVIAPDDSWANSSEAFDHIISSMKPIL